MCVTEPRKTNKSKTTEDGMGSWKFSTFKSIRIIAFFDLIVAVIFAVYRGVCLSILLGKIPTKSDRELAASSSRLSGANMIVIKNPGNSSTRDNYGESSLQDGTYTRYWSVVLLTGIVITFAVEVFLFLLLNSGAPMRNLRHCKHWFFMRVLLLLFSIFGSIIDVLLHEYSWISGILEIEKAYRVGTLLIMWKFMDEIKTGDFDNSKLNYFGTDAGSSNVFGSYSQAP